MQTLNTQADQTLCLSDGRTLGYSRFGATMAEPVLMFHGIPGSRYFVFPEGTPLDDSVMQLILPERPGYGLSDKQTGRTILHWCDDISQLLDSLEIDRFHVIGQSGGGPYALACAHQMPDRVKTVTLVASVAPLTVTQLCEGMALSNKLALYLARHFSLAIKCNYLFNYYSLFNRPRVYLEKLYTQLSVWDEKLLQDKDRQALFLRHMREAYRPGVDGAVSDIQLLLRPWGFDLHDITTPVNLWQGEIDPLVPPAMGRYLSTQLPHCQSNFIAGAGHLLFLDSTIMQDILWSLTGQGDSPSPGKYN